MHKSKTLSLADLLELLKPAGCRRINRHNGSWSTDNFPDSPKNQAPSDFYIWLAIRASKSLMVDHSRPSIIARRS